jgi:hypothetical protein
MTRRHAGSDQVGADQRKRCRIAQGAIAEVEQPGLEAQTRAM